MRNRVRRWLRRHGVYTGSIRKVRFYQERHELPDLPAANELAIAGTPSAPKWALLDCPCGTGHTILLPLSATMHPHWQVTVSDNGRPTIYPSIDRQAGRRCHYWLRDGEITWV